VAGTGTAVLLAEGLVWRAFRNRREVGGLLGFTPQPYQSGAVHRDQGVSRAGNGRLRALSVQLAWSWLRWQPSSALARWYQQRFAAGGGRGRRIGIIALARKLLIALWRYATQGVRPGGDPKAAQLIRVALHGGPIDVPGRRSCSRLRPCRTARVSPLSVNWIEGGTGPASPDGRT
jgi:transposase